MKIDALDQQQVSFEEEWSASNDHWIHVGVQNRILLIFTIPARVTDFKYEDLLLTNIGYVNREAFSVIKRCILLSLIHI